MTILSRLRPGAFALPLAAICAAAILFISEVGYRRSLDATAALSDATAAQFAVRRVLALLVDAETGQRGYLLTGQREYLEPYRNAIESLSDQQQRLQALYSDRPDMLGHLDKLRELVADRLSVVAETVVLMDKGDAKGAQQLILTGIGKERMDASRATAEQLLAVETARGSAATRSVRDSLLLNRIGVGALTLLCLVALILYLRQSAALDALRKAQQEAAATEKNRLNQAVRHRTAELADLARRLQAVREDERSRLARELHDELGALFTAAKLDVARIKTRVASVSPEATERLTHLNETLNSGIALKRRIIEDLRPSALSNLGLVAALQILTREFESRCGTKVDVSLETVAVPPESELTIYRLVQESLTNIAKYAKARRVQVELLGQGNQARVSVVDDGVGFDPANTRLGALGLMGMQYRVEGEGGTLTLQSAPGRGTRIEATLPALAMA